MTMTPMMAAPVGTWEKLSAALNPADISWRADGKPTARDGKYFARFVPYVEANTVRERLDSTVPGNWDVTMELLPSVPYTADEDVSASFKARLQILGVIREGIGTGKDYKSAATDAFKRAAVQFGIGHELYDFEQNWVEVDSDSKYAKAVEDPQKAYERRHGSGAKQSSGVQNGATPGNPGPGVPAGAAPAPLTDVESVKCPVCSGKTWDNRISKKNPKAPDYKCQNRSCDGVIWPPKAEDSKRPVAKEAREEDYEDFPGALEEAPDDLGF
jgi:hypothetical protein